MFEDERLTDPLTSSSKTFNPEAVYKPLNRNKKYLMFEPNLLHECSSIPIVAQKGPHWVRRWLRART